MLKNIIPFIDHSHNTPHLKLLGYFALGAIATLGWAPFHLWPLTWIAIVIVLKSISLRYHGAFLFGFSLFSFLWITNAFSVVGLGVWGPSAVILMGAILALIRLATIWVFTYALGNKILSVTLGYICGEWIQSHLPIINGLPWNLLAYTWQHPSCWQSVAWWGAEGLSALMWLSMGLLAYRRWVGVTLFWAGLIGWGAYHLSHHPLQHGDFRVRLVHPCIQQADKWKKSHFQYVMDRMDTLSNHGVGVDLVIWPEAAIPTWMTTDLAAWAWPYETPLVTGAIRHDSQGKIYNCLSVIRSGIVESTYDKRHLTPFGEYMPLKLPFSKLTNGALDYSSGAHSVILNIKNKKFWPIICYESIFGNEMKPPKNEVLDGVILITNDGWFGTFSGPQQHAHIAKFRAVEWNLPIVRVANNGISSVIDKKGRVVASTQLDQVGALEATLPH